jgi:hypothetical protein
VAGNKHALTKALKRWFGSKDGRALNKALNDWSGPNHGEGSCARTIAAHFADAVSVPNKLREPLRALTMTCLACETADEAPAGTPSFPELYRQREAAFTVFGDAVAAYFRKPRTRIEPPRDAEGIMYYDRTREPEEP